MSTVIRKDLTLAMCVECAVELPPTFTSAESICSQGERSTCPRCGHYTTVYRYYDWTKS